MESTDLKAFVKIYNDSVEFRKMAGNRLRYCKGNDSFKEAIKQMNKKYRDVEKDIQIEIKGEAGTRYPLMYKWLTDQRGIGVVFAGGLLGYIGDISRFDTVSKLWAYAGMGVVDICQDCGKRYMPAHKRGEWILHTADRLKQQNDKLKDKSKKKTKEQLIKQAEGMLCHCEAPAVKRQGQRKVTGQLADFNPDFKKLCYLIGDQFIKQRESPYRKLYDQFRLDYENRPDLMKERDDRKGGQSKGTAHINAMARRKTVKIFLSHLWEEWRTVEGLPTPEPYSFGILGHTDKIERPGHEQ